LSTRDVASFPTPRFTAAALLLLPPSSRPTRGVGQMLSEVGKPGLLPFVLGLAGAGRPRPTSTTTSFNGLAFFPCWLLSPDFQSLAEAVGQSRTCPSSVARGFEWSPWSYEYSTPLVIPATSGVCHVIKAVAPSSDRRLGFPTSPGASPLLPYGVADGAAARHVLADDRADEGVEVGVENSHRPTSPVRRRSRGENISAWSLTGDTGSGIAPGRSCATTSPPFVCSFRIVHPALR
jgi:hypothetical protein